ncbi:hypothetical protein HK096_001257 [Nowakowskiella sp. JEL0078]|nr:hypothetical protein HK096_001257 [Nowakowskiella sp. JEL0078]
MAFLQLCAVEERQISLFIFERCLVEHFDTFEVTDVPPAHNCETPSKSYSHPQGVLSKSLLDILLIDIYMWKKSGRVII